MSGRRVVIFVRGEPAPGGSKKGFPIKRPNGKIGVVISDDGGKKTKTWKAEVASTGHLAMHGSSSLLQGPLRLVLHLYMPRIGGHYGSGKNQHKLKDSAPWAPITRPDSTKLLRPIEDALIGVFWRDDAQIVHQVVRKWYADPPNVPGAVLVIEELEPQSAPNQAEYIETMEGRG